MIKLYGSFTSPFVRRVRYILQTLEINYEQIDTLTDSGQDELRMRSPIWKVPYLEIDGVHLWDSHKIIDYLFEKYGSGHFRIPSNKEKWRDYNIINAIDACVESGINVFYLGREGILPTHAPYLQKQVDRVISILNWLKKELKGSYFFEDQLFGLSELYFYTILDWMIFRKTYPVNDDKILVEFLEYHSNDKILIHTAPR